MEKMVTIIGGGLAGSEAAWQVARRGVSVRLYEMRPGRSTGAHRTEGLAELVFELADLLGNGAGGDVQFFCGAGEGQVPRGRLEGAQGVESGKAVFLGHFA